MIAGHPDPFHVHTIGTSIALHHINSYILRINVVHNTYTLHTYNTPPPPPPPPHTHTYTERTTSPGIPSLLALL